jgi:plasmid stabilization system protein ParE
MIGYRFLSAAEEEMMAAAVFYEAAAVGLGRDFLDDVQQAIESLREYPELGVEVGIGLRRTLLHRFPFTLIYAVEADGILVIAIAHARRRPGYWQSRT